MNRHSKHLFVRTTFCIFALVVAQEKEVRAAISWTGEIEHEVRQFTTVSLDYVTFDWFYFEVAASGDYSFTMSPLNGTRPRLLRWEIFDTQEVPLNWVGISPILANGPRTDTITLAAGSHLLKLTTEKDNWDEGDGIVPFFPSEDNNHGAYSLTAPSAGLTLTRVSEGNLDGTFTTTIIPEPTPTLLALLALGGYLARRRL